jgi:hypothetical protein
MARACPWACVVLLGMTSLLSAQDGRLEQVRQQVSAPGSDSGSSKGSGGSDSDDGCGGLIGPLFCYTVISPFVVPRLILDDEWERRAYFFRYPYQSGSNGFLSLDRPAAENDARHTQTQVEPDVLRGWSMRLELEDGNDFNGINRFNGRLTFDTMSRLGLSSNWNWFHESLTGGGRDDTLIGDTNLLLRFAQHEQAQFHAGLGFRTMTDHNGTHWGYNVTYGADFFPVRPIVVSTTFDLGSLGSAGVVHARGTVGMVQHGWEVFGGYDFLRIGSVNLQGPVAGVRFWF